MLVADPDFPAALYSDFPMVTTDRNGRANVLLNLQSLGAITDSSNIDTAASHTVTASFGGAYADDIVFEATARIATAAANINIVSGNPQSEETGGVTEPLVVIVTDLAERIVQGVDVRFTTDSGALSKHEGDPGGTPTFQSTGGAGHFRRVDVKTDANGKASIRYTGGDVAGVEKVHTRILAYDGEFRQKTFTINVGGARDVDDEDDDDEDEEGRYQYHHR